MDFSCEFFKEIDELKSQGRYNEARRRLQDAADRKPDDCNVQFHWARIAKESGLLAEAKACCDRCHVILHEQPVDELRRALVDVMTILVDHYMAGTSPETAVRASDIFEEHLRHRKVDDYGPVRLSLLSAYHGLRYRLKLSGDERYVVAPRLGSAFFWDLYRSMLRQERYLDAFSVVNCSRTDQDEGGEAVMAELLEDMLAQASIPVSIRAMCTEWKAEYIASTRPGRQWISLAKEALRLYQVAGNVPWADDTRLQLIKRSGRRRNLSDMSLELFQIQERAEEYGFALLALKALHSIEEIHDEAFVEMPSATSAQVTSQLKRLRQKCQNSWLELYHLSFHLSNWAKRGSNEGRLLPAVQQLHQKAKDMNLTFQIMSSAGLLRLVCLKLGDGDALDACLRSLPSQVPEHFLRSNRLDPFFEELERATSIPDQDLAFEKLCHQAEAVKVHVAATESIQTRAMEVTWLTDVQRLYITLMGSDPDLQPARFVEKCSEAVESLYAQLSEEHADQVRYLVASNKANFHFLRCARLFMTAEGKTPDESQAENEIALGLFNEAAASKHCSRDAGMKASTHGMIAACHKNRWFFKQLPKDSDDFREADRHYRLAMELSRGCGNMKAQLLAMKGLLNLWKLGSDWSVKGLDQRPSETLLQVCQEYEELVTLQRADRSALRSSRALLAKQALRNDGDVQSIYETAIDLLASGQDDAARLWTWVQGSKSRSVSDMLALGIKIPAPLSLAIEQHDSLAEMLEEEENLVQQLDKSGGGDFALRRELENLQNTMRQNPVLSRVFALREGRATTIETLTEVSKRWTSLRPDVARKTVFVDWFICGRRKIHCMLATDRSSCLLSEDTGAVLEDVETWRKIYFERTNDDSDDDEEHKFSVSGNMALAELTKLIKLVVDNSHEGDLLIFCPASTLHGLPLHAALIDDTSDRSLIERNPIVYTSSMTTFEYCVSRQLDDSKVKEKLCRNSFVAVFESLEDEALDDFGRVQREQIYASVRSLAERLPGSSTTIGPDASPERMADAFDADFVSFFGHCSFEPTNYLDQGLVLAAKADSSEAVTTALFTASQMFDIDMRASNVMLMACGSAMQSHAQGDEPLGITTALLCVGASSVTGTLWKTRVPTALAFNSAFHVALSREQKASDGSGLLDLAQTVQVAICRLKQRPDTRSPLQWASFVLNGSWFMKQRS